MSSLARYASKAVKTPAGRSKKAQQDQQFVTSLGYEPYCFQVADLEALLSSSFQKVSDSIYIAQTKTALNSVLTSLNNLNDYRFDVDECSAVDLGKTIRIGVSYGDNDIITMRLVKRTGNVESAGGPNSYPNICYVVTGNKMSDNYNNALRCNIIGTTPNNRSRKPFLNNGGYTPAIVSIATLESIFASTLKVSGSLYLARNTAEFGNVMSALANVNNYETLPSNELSSIDLGKSVRIGIVGGDNDLLVFRLVKRTGNVLGLGSPNNNPNVGYLAVASKVNKSEYLGASEVQVTGTSPNALEVKPQNLLNGGYEPAIFPEGDLQSILSNCVNVSGGLYLARDAAQLASVCGALNNWNNRDYLPSYTRTSVDMGKTIRLGLVGGESDLITFVSNKALSIQGNGDNLTAGYSVVASKLSQDYINALYPSVLGVAPRDS
jgi:hypothetical protein